jgi:hypothetical protein
MICRRAAMLVSIAAPLFLPFGAYADELNKSATEQITIIYLHGRIIEDEGVTPTHPTFGLYDYPAILTALGSRGANVISEARPPGTDAGEYARETISRIDELLDGAVRPENIVVVGFSKGGIISIIVSDSYDHPDIRYVIMAACAGWLDGYPELRLTGHVLSVHEESDASAGSCRSFAERNDELGSFREFETSTGKQHGAYYLPYPEWIVPVLDWIDSDEL